jgi:N-methylhydantoinase A
VDCWPSVSARIGVRERVAYDGSVLLPLCEADVLQAAETLRAAGVASVASIAICLLHSYANPTHERRCRARPHGLSHSA